MKSDSDNIEMLERAILAEARDESDQILAEANAKADQIRQRGTQQAEVERKQILDRARQDAERLRGQAVASAQLKARALQLEHREKLLDEVFKAAREKLAELRKRPDYDQIVARLLTEALGQLRVENALVRGDAATQKSLKDGTLKKLAGELKVQLETGEPLEEGTGLVVDAANGHVHFDNTFETRLSRLQGILRSSVYQVLMGEKS